MSDPVQPPAAQDTTQTADAQSQPAIDAKAPDTNETGAATETKPVETLSDKEALKAPVVPEKYDLKLAKNSPLDAAYVEKFSLEAKQKGFSQEQAQAMLERDQGLKTSFIEEQKSFMKQKAGEWFEEAKNDKEIGGEAFKENVEVAKRALDRFASEPLKKVLNDTGLGNNPELIRTFMKIGRMIGQDKLVTANSGQAPQRNLGDMLYPTTKS